MADKKISALTAATTPLAGTEVLPIVQSSTTVKVSVANLTAGRDMSAAAVTTTKNVIFGASYAGGAWTTDYFDTRYLTNRIFNVPSGSGYVFAYGGGDGVTFDSSGNITPNIGNFKPIAGKGIDFSANTHAAGMTSELLTWYEEGVWTPVIAGASTAGTYELNTSTTKATYTRIGRVVHLSAYINLAGAITGGGTGELTITGLPFAKGANIPAWGITSFSNVDYAANANLACYFGSTGASATLFIWETNDNAGVTLTPISAVSANDVIGISITYEV